MGGSDEFIDYWNVWGLDVDEFNEIINNTENAYSGIFGYVSEVRVREQFFQNHEHITNLGSPRDHDKSVKGDIKFDYKGKEIKVEVKSLNGGDDNIQIDTDLNGDTVYKGTAQVMASDKRNITFENGDSKTSSLLEIGEFDILAVNMFEYFNEWKFMFIKNEDLPISNTHDRLLQSNPDATYPPEKSTLPYSEDPFELIEETLEEDTEETDEVKLEISDPETENASLDDF